VIHGGGRLEQLDLRQHLELATSFVEVDETVVRGVAESRVDHHQIREKCTKVRHGTLDRRRTCLQQHPQQQQD